MVEKEKAVEERKRIMLACCGKTYLTDGIFTEIGADGELGTERIYRFKRP